MLMWILYEIWNLYPKNVKNMKEIFDIPWEKRINSSIFPIHLFISNSWRFITTKNHKKYWGENPFHKHHKNKLFSPLLWFFHPILLLFNSSFYRHIAQHCCWVFMLFEVTKKFLSNVMEKNYFNFHFEPFHFQLLTLLLLLPFGYFHFCEKCKNIFTQQH